MPSPRSSRPSAALLCTLAICCLHPRTWAQTDDAPVRTGFITDATPGHLAVDGMPLELSKESRFGHHVEGGLEMRVEAPPFYLGEPATVYGSTATRHKVPTLVVDRLLFDPPHTTPVHAEGVVEVAGPVGQDGTQTLRAGGYRLRRTAETRVTDPAGAPAPLPLHTDLWLVFEGEQQPDGSVLVRRATVDGNEVETREDKLRQHAEYDPAAVDPNAHQGALSKAFRGLDPKQLPPWPDTAMQERVERVGRSVIPAFQKALPPSDPTRIDFRFQVVEGEHWRDAMTLPNGIILVPHQVADRLEDDTELATVLADNVASALEKQSLRLIPAQRGLTAGQIAGAAGGLLVPGLGFATSIASASEAKHLMTLQNDESGRVSLGLLHDAGYDLTRAPLAWRRLAGKPGKPLDEVALPARSINLYRALGTTWRETVTPSGAPGSPSATPSPAAAGRSTP